ncbi:hypothetical protein LJY25_00220 [Hymenobacter sp. BT175]|uniref:hypothetical protein n=1 Tax=Hymenobacter translucens TaxID=2886507 RepID=UPI001D0DD832|nr:hypothetical protein [Hymenobacter translucens]MCC2544853.1 hypothetical protein [Hymenobacter translucens]
MPKTIDYPRTSYTSAWEVAEVVDDTGGKCAIDTCARKLNRKVSGSFKAIIGSAVKFGLVTSKRELLTTTNLFRRIKHAYDKQEEKVFHREAFLNPPLFTQICRKFRSRELPVHMFDVILIREFGVEEINAQNVAKAFLEGARMVGIMDERNVLADIDQLSAQQTPRREIASTDLTPNLFRGTGASPEASATPGIPAGTNSAPGAPSTPHARTPTPGISPEPRVVPPARTYDAVSRLFGLDTLDLDAADASAFSEQLPEADRRDRSTNSAEPVEPGKTVPLESPAVSQPGRGQMASIAGPVTAAGATYSIRISGPGMDTQLVIQDQQDLDIVRILLDKIRKQLPE